jgi:hypothetical protein
MLFYDVLLVIRYTCCREPRIKVLTIILPVDENFPKVTSDSLVEYFIYYISRPTGDTYVGQVLVNLVIYRRAIYIL